MHGGDEHWGSDEACFMSSKTSLENGFYIQVAICGDKIVPPPTVPQLSHLHLYPNKVWLYCDSKMIVIISVAKYPNISTKVKTL